MSTSGSRRAAPRDDRRDRDTNARLTRAQANKFAQIADDGLARAIRPAHGTGDGDTVLALATGTVTRTRTSPSSAARLRTHCRAPSSARSSPRTASTPALAM
ncbi:P1 family peptidase [Piscinibacter sp.]|uniref:P1 family peptidase n=1 Tax=Piscinibacter sp. TaxID=1903157 RepID=UPI002C679FF1|nr:P1 family peptidase [Albitalea sp.]HUG21545.1 P1 family peptidase [Albitalea sp.]